MKLVLFLVQIIFTYCFEYAFKIYIYIYIYFRDDVGDYKKWAEKFGAKTIIHEKEVDRRILEAPFLGKTFD